MPTFTDLPFTHGDNFTKWLAPFVGMPVHGLEIGSYEGGSSLWLMENILTHPQSQLTCVDTWEGEENQKIHEVNMAEKEQTFLENTVAYRECFPKRIVVVKGDSARMVRQFGMHYYSFAYVDGSHQAPDLLIDLVNVFLVLKRGGVCIVDDYLWHPGLGVLHEPRLAIDAFLIVFDELIEVLDIGYQVAIRKR